MNGKGYLPHHSSILKTSARATVVGILLIAIVIDLLPTINYFGWIPAILFMYFEKKSIYVKYHATQLVMIEIIKVVASFLLLLVSIFFDIPYYAGEYGTPSFKILPGGYLDLSIVVLSTIILLIQLWYAWKYQEFKGEKIRAYVYRMMKKDPKFDQMVRNTPIK